MSHGTRGDGTAVAGTFVGIAVGPLPRAAASTFGRGPIFAGLGFCLVAVAIWGLKIRLTRRSVGDSAAAT